MAARVSPADLDRLRAKVLGKLPAAAKSKLKAANVKNADDFFGRVQPLIPREDGSDPRRSPGTLASTLTKGEQGELGAFVALGGPAAPYALHLEAGHRTKNGATVPPKRFWNPVRRLMRKTARSRQTRAIREAAKIAAGSAS